MKDNAIEIRRAILALVERFPGLHLRDLARRVELSEALAGYHLEALERDGYVHSRFDAFYRRFYPAKAPAPTQVDETLLGMLRQRVPIDIAINLLERSPLTHGDLAKSLSLAKSTVSYHVAKLEAAKLVTVSADGIRLREPERIRRLLLTYRPPEDVTERFAQMWRKFYRSAK